MEVARYRHAHGPFSPLTPPNRAQTLCGAMARPGWPRRLTQLLSGLVRFREEGKPVTKLLAQAFEGVFAVRRAATECREDLELLSVGSERDLRARRKPG